MGRRTETVGYVVAAVVTFSAAIVDWNGPQQAAPAPTTAATVAATTTTAVARPTSTTTAAVTTTVAATTTTVPVPGDWQCPDVVNMAARLGWPDVELVTLDRVVWRESRCQSDAVNTEGRDRSYGLMQINTKGGLWPDRRDLCGLTVPTDLWDPATNLTCGLHLFRRSGWGPWGGDL